MRFIFRLSIILVLFASTGFVYANETQRFDFFDSWSAHGITLENSTRGSVTLNFSIEELELETVERDGETQHRLIMPGDYLPNDEGAPNLPAMSRYVALPQGAQARLNIADSRTEVLENINMEPAPRIPAETDDSPLEYNPDMQIYSRNAYYPEEPVLLSEETDIRGLDVVIVGITPFQYNPVTQELVIYRDFKIEIDFVGGTGHFGDDRLRSKWFDPIIYDLVINSDQIPRMNYNSRNTREDYGYEYIVIVPDDPDFIAWGDSIKVFRNMQGIKTDVVTTTDIGGNNHNMIRNYIQDAYNNWDIPPVAVLLLADYGTTGNTITSELRTDHPSWSTSSYITDHYYSDMNNNLMSDVILARITAQHENDLETMVTKFIDYERNPPTNFDYYNNPITAMGWQTERWFQLCAEIVNGFWEFELSKEPVRQNNIYSGSPSNSWSSNQNTSMIVNYFGPNGLGYIPATPSHLHNYGWDANSTTLNNNINNGAFMILHRDHGAVNGWGEPDYRTYHLPGLNNDDLIYVFSINCLTGKFDAAQESFTEAFHRHQQGALGVIAASDISYSFVNDTFVWGMFDNMWPQFMPANTNPPEPRGVLPGFANAAGKYFLQGSNWPYNTQHKEITYRLFHHHGDAFSTVYTEMPEELTVNHAPVIFAGTDYFTVTADEGANIALTVDGEIIGTAEGTGQPENIDIIPQVPPSIVDIVITKQDYYRYHEELPIIADGAYVVYNDYEVNDELGNDNGLVDYSETIMLGMEVKNLGNDPAENVEVTLSTDDEYITITEDTHTFALVPADETVFGEDIFTFDVSNEIPNEHDVMFMLSATDGDEVWDSYFTIKCYAPIIEFVGVEIDDSQYGNNNGMFDPGETVDLMVSIENVGGADAYDALVSIFTTDPFITLIDSDPLPYGDIEFGETVAYGFTVSADHSTPQAHPVIFEVDVEAEHEITASDEFEIRVGDYFIEEYFDDWLPEDWETYASSGDVHWDQFNGSLAGGEAPEARFDGSFTNNSTQRLISKPVNTIDTEELILQFGHYVTAYSGNYTLSVETSSDGENWNTVATIPNSVQPTTTEEIVIDNEDVGAEEFRVAWTFNGNPAGLHWWNIDNVLLQGGAPSLGTLEGVVTLDGGPGNVTNVQIAIGGIFISPDEQGFFAATLLPNTYELTATLDEYVPLTISDIEIEADETVNIEINMEYMAPPVDLEYDVDHHVVTLMWDVYEEQLLSNSSYASRRNANTEQNSRPLTEFNIYRSYESGDFELIDSSSESTYIDEVEEGGYYQYYVTAVYDEEYESEPSNTVEIDVVDATDNLIPMVTELNSNYPNPFNPETTISYSLSSEEHVLIEIYNIRGQLVNTLKDQKQEAGYHTVTWNGRDNNNRPVASGVYFTRFRAGKHTSTKKMILMK